MAIVDDYAAIAAELRRLRAESPLFWLGSRAVFALN
jgi:hypothetical protein